MLFFKAWGESGLKSKFAIIFFLSGLAKNSCYSDQKQHRSSSCKGSFGGGFLEYNSYFLTVEVQVQTTKKEMKATSAEIEENRAALASFLAGMRVQVLKLPIQC